MSSSGFPSKRLSSKFGSTYFGPAAVFVFAEAERAARDPVRPDFAEAHSVALAPAAVGLALVQTPVPVQSNHHWL